MDSGVYFLLPASEKRILPTPAAGNIPQNPSFLPVNSHLGVVTKVVHGGPWSTSTTLSINLAPNDVSMALTFSCAESHMFLHAMTVITGLSLRTRAALDFRNPVIGSDGDRNHT